MSAAPAYLAAFLRNRSEDARLAAASKRAIPVTDYTRHARLFDLAADVIERTAAPAPGLEEAVRIAREIVEAADRRSILSQSATSRTLGRFATACRDFYSAATPKNAVTLARALLALSPPSTEV